MLIGYARVSTQGQDNALQLDALARLGCSVVFEEKGSGATRKGRKELARCLASLRKGDMLCVYKIDRIARSLFDLLDILHHLDRVGAAIKSVTELLDTTNPMGVFMVQILGAVAQLERSMIRERSIAGQRSARERGRVPGRVRSLGDLESKAVAEYLSGGCTYAGLVLKYGASVSAIKRAVYRVTKPAEYAKRCKL